MLKLGLHEQLQKFKLANHSKAEIVEMTFVSSRFLVKSEEMRPRFSLISSVLVVSAQKQTETTRNN